MKDHCAICGDDREDYFCPTCKRTFEMTIFTEEDLCEYCHNPEEDCECYSPCCGELLDPDNRVCPNCLENC